MRYIRATGLRSCLGTAPGDRRASRSGQWTNPPWSRGSMWTPKAQETFCRLPSPLGLLFSRAGPGTHRACGDGLGNPTTGYRGTVSLNRGSLPRVRRGSADGRRCCGFRTPDVVGLGGGNRRIRMIRIVTNGAILCALDPPSEETAFECSIRTALRMVRANAWISSRTIAKQPSPVRSG